MKLVERQGKRMMPPSHPSRGAWIEIWARLCVLEKKDVAPLAGCVD